MILRCNLLFFFFLLLSSGCNLFTYKARERIVGTWNSINTEDGVTSTLTDTYLKDNRFFSQMVIQGGPRKVESFEVEGTWRVVDDKFLHIQKETLNDEEYDSTEVFEIEFIGTHRLDLRSTETGGLYVYER